MKFIVITEVPEDGAGNLACAMGDVFIDCQAFGEPYGGRPRRLGEVVGIAVELYVQTPLFTLGEVLICDGDGRELDGIGRKPAKWSVAYEEFDDLRPALDRAGDVREANHAEWLGELRRRADVADDQDDDEPAGVR